MHGFRIELGEIEALLDEHAKVKRSVVQDREEAGERYLVAYILPEEGESPGRERTPGLRQGEAAQIHGAGRRRGAGGPATYGYG